MTDTEILNWLQRDRGKRVFSVGGTWYWRAGYNMPHRRAGSLREAVIYAAGLPTQPEVG